MGLTTLALAIAREPNCWVAEKRRFVVPCHHKRNGILLTISAFEFLPRQSFALVLPGRLIRHSRPVQ
jgi:hypothetical protein